MARQIIILDVSKQASGDFEVTAAFWLTAPANRTVPKPTATSAVPGLSSAELTAIQAGSVVEKVIGSGLLPSGTTAAQVKTGLIAILTAQQNALSATAAGAQFIGLSYDGTTWS